MCKGYLQPIGSVMFEGVVFHFYVIFIAQNFCNTFPNSMIESRSHYSKISESHSSQSQTNPRLLTGKLSVIPSELGCGICSEQISKLNEQNDYESIYLDKQPQLFSGLVSFTHHQSIFKLCVSRSERYTVSCFWNFSQFC